MPIDCLRKAESKRQHIEKKIPETKTLPRAKRVKELYLHKQGKENEYDNQIKRTVHFFKVITEIQGIFPAKISMITDKAKFYWKRRNKEELIKI